MSNRSATVVLSVVLGVLLTLSPSCSLERNTVVSPPATPKNQPVIVSTTDVFTFTVDAVNYSYSTTQAVSFSSDSLVATLVVTNYSLGTGEIESSTADGIPFYSEVLNGDRTAVLAVVPPSTPRSVSISLAGYTGAVSFVLAKKK
jgi:hypothetical protein